MNMDLMSRRAMVLALGATAAAPAVAQLLPEQTPRPQLDVPYVPTPQEVVERMLGMAQVTAGDFVMDLGCGDGRMLITAATRYGARGFGVDLNPQRIREANENAKAAQVTDKVRFEVKNLFDTSIRDADVLTMYRHEAGQPRRLPRLRHGRLDARAEGFGRRAHRVSVDRAAAQGVRAGLARPSRPRHDLL